MNFSELMEFNKDFFGDETWIIEVFIIVLLTGFINFIQKYCLTRLPFTHRTMIIILNHAKNISLVI